jgi:amino acid transporter
MFTFVFPVYQVYYCSIIIGAGIFKMPSMVAANSGTSGTALFLWLAGGVISLIGALCYAELASAYPSQGGEYHFLHRALGNIPSFLFAWARMTVIQAGSIAMLAFLVGDYASQILPLSNYSSSWYAASIVVALTLVNVAGLRQGSGIQKLFMIAIVLGLVLVIATGLALAAPSAVLSAARRPAGPRLRPLLSPFVLSDRAIPRICT